MLLMTFLMTFYKINDLLLFIQKLYLCFIFTNIIRYLCNSLVQLGMLNASTDFRLFLGIYYDQNDSNIYIEYHIWISSQKQQTSKGGIHVRHPIQRYHAITRTARPPPTPTPLNPPNHGKPSQSFLIQIPIGECILELLVSQCRTSDQ